MFRTLLLVVLLAAAALLGGCATLSKDSEQEVRSYSRISELDRRMWAEDMDTFWLLDHPSRLTPYHLLTNP
jgi:hypothetical protein